MSAQDERNRGVRHGQWLLFSAVAGAVVLLAVLWMGAGGGNNAPPLRGIAAELAGPGEAEAGWVRQSETRFGGIEARLRDIESSNRRLEDENLRLQLQLRDQAEEAQSVIDIQAARIDELTTAGGTPLTVPATAPFGPSDAIRPSVGPTPTGQPEPGAAAPMSAPLVREFELEDRSGRGANAETLEPIPVPKPTAGYVPAGSYAEAVVIAGADASAGVQSQGDPRPVLLRLTSPAYGAAVDGTAETTDIEGCTVTGAAYGDLSSEKVYVRLQTMACAGQAAGSVIETAVSGFVAGRRQGGCARGGGEPRRRAGPEGFPGRALLRIRGERDPGVQAPGGARRRRHGDICQYGPRRHRACRNRRWRRHRRPGDQRLPHSPGRAIPAGHSTGRGHARDRGVPGRRVARRANQRTDGESRMTALHRTAPRRLFGTLVALFAIGLGGCASTNVGNTWQCPLLQGSVCARVAEADPAAPQSGFRWKCPQTTGTAVESSTVRARRYRSGTGARAPSHRTCVEVARVRTDMPGDLPSAGQARAQCPAARTKESRWSEQHPGGDRIPGR